jgi:UDP-glucose 4-epimerase
LVTGSTGQVGQAAKAALEATGWTVRTFDIADGDDLLDEKAVLEAVEGCDVIVHAGAIPSDNNGTPADIVAVNVLGTWHVLLAAEACGIERVVVFSSAQVFGCFNGGPEPDYLPIDDDHPLRAARPYGMSKRLVELMCEAWTARTGIPTVVFRPVLILSEERFGTTRDADADLHAVVHLDDVSDAVVKAVTAPVSGHVCLTLSGSGPFASAAANRVLGWQPRHRRPPGDPSDATVS